MLLSPLGCDAITLDWSTETWVSGSLSNSYHVDPNVAGNNLSVTISGDTSILGSEPPQTPAITTLLQGGLASPASTLTLYLVPQTNTQAVTVTVNFAASYGLGVNNVSFSIFDIDTATTGGSNFKDELRNIIAIDMNGNQVAATITTSSANTVSGTGLTQVVDGIAISNDTGAGSGNGNVTISFGSTPIKSFSYTYGNAPIGGFLTGQHAGMYNLSFTPIPEINPAWCGAFSCIVVGLLIRRHNARFRK